MVALITLHLRFSILRHPKADWSITRPQPTLGVNLATPAGPLSKLASTVTATDLDLDLDVFAGPFDLLMAVVLREGVNLAEVELGEIVVAYVEHLDEQGELDLEAATEFLVLIASLLELKSRLLLPAPEEDEPALGPEEAAHELLARMLEYRRYRGAADHLAELFAEGRRYIYRSAPLPPELRRVSLEAARPAYEPTRLAQAIGELLRVPPAPDTSHIRPTVSLEKRLLVLRELLRGRKEFDFDERFGDEDRLTQAVTLFALLEMHKRGEATWKQKGIFGPITVTAGDPARRKAGGKA
jgi:segregation and condensation protein A